MRRQYLYQSYQENSNSNLKSSHMNNIPKTAPRKTRKDSNFILTDDFEISEEDFFNSMLNLDVQPICRPKRISKTPTVEKRKKKIHNQEITPIQKIDTQKLNSHHQESKRASTAITTFRPSRNNGLLSSTNHSIKFNQPQNFRNSESKSTNLIDPLKITQMDLKSLKNSKPKFSSAIQSTRKNCKKSYTNYIKPENSARKNKLVKFKIENGKEDDTQENNHKEIEAISEKKNEKNSIKFDKDSFLKKLENIDNDIKVKSTLSFTNGRVLPSLHYQKEPDRYVIACAIHIAFSFNFFTYETNPKVEKHLSIDEDSYDLFDSGHEYSNRLCRSSRYIQAEKEIFNSCFTNPLEEFLTSTPPLTRRNIEKQHFFQQEKFLNPNLKSFHLETVSKIVQLKYVDGKTTDSAFPLIGKRIECQELSDDEIIKEESDEDNDLLDSCFECNLSNLKNLKNIYNVI